MTARVGEHALGCSLARVVDDGRDAVGLHLRACVRVKGVLVVIRDNTVSLKRCRRPERRDRPDKR